jgi:hypothetical protein
MSSIIFSPYEKELDMSDKYLVKLNEKGSEKIPTKFTGEVKNFRFFINKVTPCATECKCDLSILTFKVNGGDLNLIKDYGQIPMYLVTAARDTCNAANPASI